MLVAANNLTEERLAIRLVGSQAWLRLKKELRRPIPFKNGQFRGQGLRVVAPFAGEGVALKFPDNPDLGWIWLNLYATLSLAEAVILATSVFRSPNGCTHRIW